MGAFFFFFSTGEGGGVGDLGAGFLSLGTGSKIIFFAVPRSGPRRESETSGWRVVPIVEGPKRLIFGNERGRFIIIKKGNVLNCQG